MCICVSVDCQVLPPSRGHHYYRPPKKIDVSVCHCSCLQEMDIDTILERAETTETEEHMGKGEELLSQFKVSYTMECHRSVFEQNITLCD